MYGKKAVVTLLDPKENLSDYDSLIQRNQGVWTGITMKYHWRSRPPVIIFHRGNIPEEHIHYIFQKNEEFNQEQEIVFKDIAHVYNGKEYSKHRFNSYYIWELCKEYEIIFRVDEDVNICRSDVEPFRLFDRRPFVFFKSIDDTETNEAVNQTLPIVIEELIGKESSTFYDKQKLINPKMFMCRVDFWRNGEVKNLLEKLCFHEQQEKYSWTDRAILGSILNLYAKDKVGQLKSIRYIDMTTNTPVSCVN